MDAVTVSTSAPRTPLGIVSRFSTRSSLLKRPFFLAFKTDRNRDDFLVSPHEPITLPADVIKDKQKSLSRFKSKPSGRVEVVSIEGVSPCAIDLDYNEAAAKLEHIYSRSPPNVYVGLDSRCVAQRACQRSKRMVVGDEKINVVRNIRRKTKRLTLEKRISLSKSHTEKQKTLCLRRVDCNLYKLVKEYKMPTDLSSMDWKKMKIPPVLSSSEHSLLFKLMQPMKALFKVNENLLKDLGRDPNDAELACATNASIVEIRRIREVGQAARNKLIKHNLRLVLFVIHKYYQEIASSTKFQELCQAGVKGLITAIDRFEPKRRFRLSTYAFFWIRHGIIRSLTTSSFIRVPFGIESVRSEIQKAKLELLLKLGRPPMEEEIVSEVGMSRERYHDVMRASKQVLSLNARHSVTQEEFINGITDIEGLGSDSRWQPTLLRLALDDVLDSLKPKESLVIRQRYGLDGKGERTLGEIAGNLNISREMVRKYEAKALMKLKHPARVDYLRRYIV